MSGMMILETGLFAYFAFGTNMLTCSFQRRIDADLKVLGIGALENYSLEFSDQVSKIWDGAFMTIVPREDSVVWGVIWELPNEYKDKLENQGSQPGYEPVTVNVTTSDGKIYKCRTFQLTGGPGSGEVVPLDQLPDNRLPSSSFMNVVIKGAQEHQLPADYIEYLEDIKHNNNELYPKGIEECLN